MRHRLTINRLDPWSVLKFGAIANIVLFAVVMLISGVMWFIIDQLELIDQACELAVDIGFTSCGVEAGNLFQALALVGAMGIIVATAVMVFGAFLFNLIADLTGGITIGASEDSQDERRDENGRAPAGNRSRGDRTQAQPSPGRGPEQAHGDSRTRPSVGARTDPPPRPERSRSYEDRGSEAPGRQPSPRRGEGEQLFGER